MFEFERLCYRCAQVQRTCCQGTEVYVTAGDVVRIANAIGRQDFWEYRVAADADYLDQASDPIWQQKVVQSDGSRRVLKRHSNEDCTFLGPQGCAVPLESRPLVCRLYPVLYTEHQILEQFGEACPVGLLAPGQRLVDAIEMDFDQVRLWHAQLYREVHEETGSSGTSIPSAEKELSCVSV